ncbi:MAG: DUF4391 domain-containing protein [Flavobacteriales bacterium]|nr:DUF4391 domain-containing protein [Flavobacteriales bacterium]
MSQLILDILQLPERCLIQKRLTKAFFLKHFSLTAAEKKLLNEGIDQMDWLASIRAAQVPAFTSDTYSYEEVQVFAVQLRLERVERTGTKVADLVQKYVPYPVLLFVYDRENYLVNASTKRINQNDASKRTLEASVNTPVLSLLYADAVAQAFHQALRFAQLDKTDLRTLYGGYMQAVVQCRAAAQTGVFRDRPAVRSAEDLATLQRIDALEAEIKVLRAKATKDLPLREQVAVNTDIQQRRAEQEALRRTLGRE